MDEKTKAIIDFIDFCIERDSECKQTLELMFMYWMKAQQDIVKEG